MSNLTSRARQHVFKPAGEYVRVPYRGVLIESRVAKARRQAASAPPKGIAA